jgi:CubicO group peptidase (beta-lactamase class C family)
MTGTAGTCIPELEPLRDLLTASLLSGGDLGASLAVVRDGTLVADLWGGEARTGEPWREDTVVQTWSVTKTMAALTVLVLVDRGLLDLDTPVATYWPEFTAKDVLVRHVLGHTSGHAGWTAAITPEDLCDLERSESLLAQQEPWWTPGTASGYHLLSYGHLLDGVVRRATGSPLAEQFRALVAEPLGADFRIGLADDDQDRCADLVPPPPSGIDYTALPPGNFLIPAMTNPLLDIGGVCNTHAWRRSPVAASNGFGNARSIAQVQALVSHGGEVGGIRLLRPETIARIFEVQADGLDQVLLQPVRFGIGYALPQQVSAPAVPPGRVCWWTGYGGAIVVNDLDRRTTVAYAMNRMENHFMASPRTDAYVRTAFECLETLA